MPMYVLFRVITISADTASIHCFWLNSFHLEEREGLIERGSNEMLLQALAGRILDPVLVWPSPKERKSNVIVETSNANTYVLRQ